MNSKLNKTKEPLSCGGCVHSRRDFIAGCTKCLGAVGLSSLVVPTILTAESCTSPQRSMKVRVVFATRGYVTEEADWPNIAFDFTPVMEKYMNALTLGCPTIEFVQSMVANVEQEKRLVEEDNARGDIDGYILIHLVCSVRFIDNLVGTGKPFLYVDFLYAGGAGFLESGARQLRNHVENYAHMPSSNLAHVVAAANCFPLAKKSGVKAFVDAVTKIRLNIVAGVKVDMECIEDKFDILSTDELLRELKTKKILAFERGYDLTQATKDSLGIDIIRLPFAELNTLWEKADRDQAMEIVKRWKTSAQAVVGVRDMTLEKSARMYLAMKQCLKNHDACAITINCLGGFYGGSIQAYPCLGFHELLNEGLVGACECDLFSTVTMVVMTTLTKGRPGFISDPVLDIPGKEIIYAHCVASNKPFGPQGPSNPFTIMTHSEDRQGASVRSTLPAGYMTTSLKMWPGGRHGHEIVFHQAKSVGNSADDRACRTKLVGVPVGDYEKLFTEWDSWGWHRVTYYGDLKKPVFDLADALGWKIIEEA